MSDIDNLKGLIDQLKEEIKSNSGIIQKLEEDNRILEENCNVFFLIIIEREIEILWSC